MTRRAFLRGSSLGIAGLGGGGGATILYALAIAPYSPVVEQVEVSLPGYPTGAPALTAVQISDIHVSPHFTATDIRRAVEVANALQPDFVVLTGDFVHHDVKLIDGAAVELGHLRARLGRFAILGNHDHWTDARRVSEALRRNGIHLLANAATRIDTDSGLWLAGVDDVWSGEPDLARALKPIPEGAPAVLLCHEPDFADRVPGRVGLQLSGHTHGGQVRIPGVGPVVLPAWGIKYSIGFARAAETLVYVNRGLGVINPPIRLNCPPEITHFVLKGGGLRGDGRARLRTGG